MSLAPEMIARAQALESMGFVVVDADAWSFVAVQSKWHWDLAMHLTTVLRVRRVQRASLEDAQQGHRGMSTLGNRWDTCKLPRGFQHGRALADVILADQADPAALQFASATVGKGLGEGVHTAIVDTAGSQVFVATPIWGRAFWPKIEHAIRVGATGRPAPAPTATLGLAVALLVMYPSLAVFALACCGVPAIVLPILLLTEKPAASVLQAGGHAYR